METVTGAQAKESTGPNGKRRIAVRVVVILMMAFLVGLFMRELSVLMTRSPRPAGFLRGVVQGAAMPCTLPNLLVGNDIVIYAPNNTGLTYKLGYTCGVNMCGALFFGLLFWRINRWRNGRKA
jgi:hypothetical protein